MQQLVKRGGQALTLPTPVTLPSLEEQLEASIRTPPVGRLVRQSLLVLGLTLVPLGGWATMTTIERAVMAPGQLIPEGRRKSISLLEPGILRKLEVTEGTLVEAGQVVAQLDVTQAESIADQARAALWSSRARVGRLRAEQAEQRTLVFSANLQQAVAQDASLATFLEAEQALFAARWANFDGQVSVSERQISQYQEQVTGARAQREGAEAQVRAVREQISGYSRLLSQGYASRFTVLNLQQQEAGFVAAIGSAASQEAQLREAVTQAQRQLSGIRLQRLSDIATDLQTTEAIIATAAQQLRAAQDVLARREVTAPEQGRITNIQFVTPGSTIPAGTPLMDLVPVRDRFIVDAQILPVDIEQVEVGQRANIRLTSYRMRQVPVLPGRVITVSPDVAVSPQGQAYFGLRAEIDTSALELFPEVRLGAGMPTEVYVLGEKRTPFSYLWSPMRQSVRRAFRD